MQYHYPDSNTEPVAASYPTSVGLAGIAVQVAFISVIVTSVLLDSSTASAQIPGETQLHAVLSEIQEVPPVAVPSNAAGTANLTVNPDQTQIAYTLELQGPFTGAPTQAHIHIGPVGVAGPVVFFLCNADPSVSAPAGTQPCPAAAGGTLSGTLSAGNLVAQQDAGITTFAEAINAILNGNSYINVHTPANGSGESRGQIGPVKLEATLNSAQEVPPVQTPSKATAKAELSLNETQTEIAYSLELQGPFTGAPTQAHIHVGAADAAGPVIFFLCATGANAPAGVQACPGAAGGTVSGTLTADNLMVQPGAGINTFDNAVNALISATTYTNVHTPANGGGEIRGQNIPATVSFAKQIQPIFTQNCAFSGCHAGTSPAAGLNLEDGKAHGNLVGVPSKEVPTLSRVKPFDPDNSYLFKKHSGAPGIRGSRMPLNNPNFFVEQPDLLELERRWIVQGGLNN
jgi:hypothetical protein